MMQHLSVWIASAFVLCREELLREADPTFLVMYIEAADHGLDHEQIRALMRQSDEWKGKHPVHHPHPPLDTWFPVRGDLCGIRLPEILEFGRTETVFTPILPCYPEAVRRAILQAHRDRGYTHIVLTPRPNYGDWYPGMVATVDEFRATLHEVIDFGLIPCVWWWPDDEHADDPASWDGLIGPYLADDAIRGMCMLNAPGWEINQSCSPSRMEWIIRWVRQRLDPAARLLVHFTPDHAAGSEEPETEQHWWARMASENLLDGIWLQLDPFATLADQVARATDFTERLVGGVHGWPTRRSDGRPMWVVAAEYDAYVQCRDEMTEDEGRDRGTALAAIPGMAGAMDGIR